MTQHTPGPWHLLGAYSEMNAVLKLGGKTDMSKIETAYGNWIAYGNDGRMTVEDLPDRAWPRQEKAGTGWRARTLPNVHGGDYGWGPLANTEAEAVDAAQREYDESISEE